MKKIYVKAINVDKEYERDFSSVRAFYVGKRDNPFILTILPV
jgi:hypothetical protein